MRNKRHLQKVKKTGIMMAVSMVLLTGCGNETPSGSVNDLPDGFLEKWGKNATSTTSANVNEMYTEATTIEYKTEAWTNEAWTTEAWTTEEWTTEEPEPEADINFATARFSNAQRFSEGVAWVVLSDFNKKASELMIANPTAPYVTVDNVEPDRTVLITMDGFILTSYEGSALYASPMIDGLSYVSFGNNDDSYEIIVDKNGYELYRTEQNSNSSGDREMHILAYGGKKFLFTRSETGIDGTKCYLGCMDETGNILSEMMLEGDSLRYSTWECGFSYNYVQPGVPAQRCFYLEAGVFYVGGDLYDSKNNEIIYGGYCPYAEGSKNGKYFYKDGAIIDWGSSKLGEDGKKQVTYTALLDSESEADSDRKYRREDLEGPRHFGAGEAYYRHGYFDLDGKSTFYLDQYEDYPIWFSTFNEEGLSLLTVYGADYNYYITVIDRDGKQLFEPFRFMYYGNDDYGMYSFSDGVVDGKFICRTDDGLCLFNAYTGELISVLEENYNDKWEYYVYVFEKDYAIIKGVYGCTIIKF